MIPSPVAELAKPLYLGAHTLARMQPRQIAGIGTRKARGLILPRLPVDFDRRYERRVPDAPAVDPSPITENSRILRSTLDETTRNRYRSRSREARKGAPSFLNRQLNVADGTNVDWYDDRFDILPHLWSLKLYAFQPLSWVCRGFQPDDVAAPELQSTFDGWIRDWIDDVEIGRPGYLRGAWTPWAVSLRIIHWSRYLGWREGVGTTGERGDFERAFERELYKNVLFLANHVERDIGGNHLIENGAALVVAGVLFAERGWIDAGVSILTETSDQFLEDGCHFERSPMYHVLTLTRYLTVCNLLGEIGLTVPEEISTTTEEATAFLRYLRPPNGRIPLLNDAVYGQALPLDDCLRYADELGFGDEKTGRWSPGTVVGSPERTSNYRWLRTSVGAMLIDGGRVGPPHLPGHSHSDTLSLLLWLDGRQVITDSGTHGYVNDSRRSYARGAYGHNTVQVGDTKPIELGRTYLMGPRPVPRTRFVDGSVSMFEGRYEARPFVGPTYTHHRVVYAGDTWWLVRDTVGHHGGLPVRSRLHLHPDIHPSIKSSGRVQLEFDARRARVYPLNGTQVGQASSEYFPKFGVAANRPLLKLHADSTEEVATIAFLISETAYDETAVEAASDTGELAHLRLDEGDHRLPSVELSP